MIVSKSWAFTLRTLIVVVSVLVIGSQTALAAPLVTTINSISGATDYSAKGVDLGKSGFWFANFGAKSAPGLVAVDVDDANSLPSWVSVDFDPKSAGYSFALNSPSSAFSTAGDASYNTLILPDASSGTSGQLVDDMNAEGTQSNNIITKWSFAAGAPTSVFLSIVLDNAPLSAKTAVNRLRVTHTSADGKSSQNATFDGLGAGANGVADVYRFRLDNMEVGGFFAVQLRNFGGSTGNPTDAAIGGVMFDPIPEPSSVALMIVGGMCIAGAAIRKRYRNRL